MMKHLLYIALVLFFLTSCKESAKEKITRLVSEWDGKEVLLPAGAVFTIQGKDTVTFDFESATYKIITYIDSIGCTSCKLQLARWKEFIHEVDSLTNRAVPFLFYFHPKDMNELRYLTRRDNFTYPVCFDEQDELNTLNHFPSEMTFQTFLLDVDNRVAAIGNPIHNPKVKEYYLNIIGGKTSHASPQSVALTSVLADKKAASLGTFDWQQPQTVDFALKNTGNHPLLIEGVTTSCDCTTAAYGKEPIASGEEAIIKVTYTAEKPEPFYRTISVYCNTPDAPIELEISGEAK